MPGAGLDRIDRSALPPGTFLANVHGHETGIAEYTIGAMLALAREFVRLDGALRRGDWQSQWSVGVPAPPPWPELAGRTLGILGYGRIGQAVARRARAFDMQIHAIRRDVGRSASDGLAPLATGADRLVQVARREAHQQLVAVLDIDRLGQASALEVGPEHLLGHGDAVRAVGADLLGEIERFVEQPFVRDAARHQSDALGLEQVWALRMPYRMSSRESLDHAQMVIDKTGIHGETIDISAGVDGLVAALADAPDGRRLGNICARMRMIALFDRSAALGALPLGTGNKSERLLGYFTWHADDSPPVNPLGDLFKTQVWALARHVGVPPVIVDKPATADLVSGQTDEGDFGIRYGRADQILHWLLLGHRPEEIEQLGFTAEEVSLVRDRLESTHWKRKLPTVAMVSQTAIGEYYLRPVDY